MMQPLMRATSQPTAMSVLYMHHTVLAPTVSTLEKNIQISDAFQHTQHVPAHVLTHKTPSGEVHTGFAVHFSSIPQRAGVAWLTAVVQVGLGFWCSSSSRPHLEADQKSLPLPIQRCSACSRADLRSKPTQCKWFRGTWIPAWKQDHA